MNNNTKMDLTPVLYIGGGLLMLKLVKNILHDLGLSSGPSGTEEAKEAALQEQLKKEADALKKVSPLTQSMSAYITAADTIYNALKYSSASDQPDIADHAFTSIINSPADLAMLKQVYGVRPTYLFGITEGRYSLIELLQREFADWRKERTVQILASKGVPLSL